MEGRKLPKDPEEGLIFEKSAPGRRGLALGESPWQEREPEVPPELARQGELPLPQVSATQVTRHYLRLSQRNFGVDVGFYPLGSCTMKYNPKVNELIARQPAWTELHPLQPLDQVQGALEVMWELKSFLEEISGCAEVSLQPAAGAQGELTGLLIFKAYFRDRGEAEQRRYILVPDTAHGTNPASGVMAGYEVVSFASDEEGLVNPRIVEEKIGELGEERIAGIMLTNPSTLGLFERHILEIADLIHQAGGLLYYDGANLNALLGIVRPADMGFDIVHINTHKTFSTPHGGGGPGAGPIGVVEKLVPYLPSPGVRRKEDGTFGLFDYPKTIGRVKSFYGNFGILLRAWAYIRMHGPEGLRRVSENAVINANYLKERLGSHYHIPYPQACMHEFVASAVRQKKQGVRALHIAKKLLEFGVHAPTVYFPLIVEEAMMIEPTETESKETLDYFADLMIRFAEEIKRDPEGFLHYQSRLPVSHIEEAEANRHPVVRWQPAEVRE